MQNFEKGNLWESCYFLSSSPRYARKLLSLIISLLINLALYLLKGKSFGCSSKKKGGGEKKKKKLMNSAVKFLFLPTIDVIFLLTLPDTYPLLVAHLPALLLWAINVCCWRRAKHSNHTAAHWQQPLLSGLPSHRAVSWQEGGGDGKAGMLKGGICLAILGSGHVKDHPWQKGNWWVLGVASGASTPHWAQGAAGFPLLLLLLPWMGPL